MSEHSTGPWISKHVGSYSTPGYVVLWADTSKGGVHYRRLDFNGGFTEVDARLISAAPELLEALQTLLTYGLKMSAKHEAPAFELARAAIAKATTA